MTSVPNVPNDTGSFEGNTKSSKPAVCVANPAKRWCFTIFNFKSDWQSQFCSMFQGKDKYVAGCEKCPKTGNTHLQCYVEFDKKERPLVRWRKEYPGIHVEKAIADRKKNLAYCRKDGNYIERGWPTDVDLDKWCNKDAVATWWEDYKKNLPNGIKMPHRLIFQQGLWRAIFFEKRFTVPPNLNALRTFMDVMYCSLQFTSYPTWWETADEINYEGMVGDSSRAEWREEIGKIWVRNGGSPSESDSGTC